jgi:hypothetical protein
VTEMPRYPRRIRKKPDRYQSWAYGQWYYKI